MSLCILSEVHHAPCTSNRLQPANANINIAIIEKIRQLREPIGYKMYTVYICVDLPRNLQGDMSLTNQAVGDIRRGENRLENVQNPGLNSGHPRRWEELRIKGGSIQNPIVRIGGATSAQDFRMIPFEF